MSPDALEKAYEIYPNPKAIIVVNLYGQSADYTKILDIAKKHNTFVIEDAAESLGATYKGEKSGSFGDIGILSFNGNKIVTTSGGGMIISNNISAVLKARFWATQSREPCAWYQHTEIGYNYRMSNISAGIGRGQLKVIEERVEKKKYIYEFYKRAFADINYIKMMPIADYGESNYWLSVFTIDDSCEVIPMNVIKALDKNNIESRPAWKPMHLQPAFKKYPFVTTNGLFKGKRITTAAADGNPADESVCAKIFSHGVCLPSDTKLNDKDLNRICNIVIDCFK
jgi:dTDP-4-amino-4,6-dideoxygalactose transaminase